MDCGGYVSKYGFSQPLGRRSGGGVEDGGLSGGKEEVVEGVPYWGGQRWFGWELEELACLVEVDGCSVLVLTETWQSMDSVQWEVLK